MNLKIASIQAQKPGKEIAEDLGVSQATVSRWLRGDQDVPSKYIRPLAELLRISPLDILPASQADA